MWEFYLAGAEVCFRYQDLTVYQIQLTKHQEALPLTRDYMIDWERTQRRLDETQNIRHRLAGE
jgi:cyclopropane-fatty-acyl-phospholipid synthase